MRYRISRAWPLDHGRLLAPSGTVIDSSSDDEWSRCARGLAPPWDAQALDDEAYQRQGQAWQYQQTRRSLSAQPVHDRRAGSDPLCQNPRHQASALAYRVAGAATHEGRRHRARQ